MKYKILIFFSFITVLAVSSCPTNPGSTPQNPIFTGTGLINISAPTGTVSTNFPDFSWTATGLSYEVAAVFTNSINVQGKKIQNTNDCIAMWTTGMKGSAGTVNYSSFKVVNNGNLTGDYVTGLPYHGTYYWAVWAYDDQLNISNSSPLESFTY